MRFNVGFADGSQLHYITLEFLYIVEVNILKLACLPVGEPK